MPYSALGSCIYIEYVPTPLNVALPALRAHVTRRGVALAVEVTGSRSRLFFEFDLSGTAHGLHRFVVRCNARLVHVAVEGREALVNTHSHRHAHSSGIGTSSCSFTCPKKAFVDFPLGLVAVPAAPAAHAPPHAEATLVEALTILRVIAVNS